MERRRWLQDKEMGGCLWEQREDREREEGIKTHWFRGVVGSCPWCNLCEVRIFGESHAGQGIMVDKVLGDGGGEIPGNANGGRKLVLIRVCVEVERALEGERRAGRGASEDVGHCGVAFVGMCGGER